MYYGLWNQENLWKLNVNFLIFLLLSNSNHPHLHLQYFTLGLCPGTYVDSTRTSLQDNLPGFVNLLSEITDKQNDTDGDDIVGGDDDSRLLTVQSESDKESKHKDVVLDYLPYSTFSAVRTQVQLCVIITSFFGSCENIRLSSGTALSYVKIFIWT